MEFGGFINNVLAFIVFSIASVTDLFDGRIARKSKTITLFGIFLDPLADKLLISAAFMCFISISMLRIGAWMVIAIIGREFLITGLRSIAAYKNVIIPADKLGKFKTTLQIIVILIIMAILIINEAFIKFKGLTIYDVIGFCDCGSCMAFLLITKMPYWTTLIAIVFTVFSGVNYVWKHRKLLSER
jgi:CDP-diacylglycerol--glycerol-3-phosphate 3-phosphatidyltransferase